MADTESRSFVAECFWPGVREADLRALDERATAKAKETSSEGVTVEYLGSLLLREDEVVLCRFEGRSDAVTQAALAAEIPFTRILETAQSPWMEAP
jgi:hypothetical protein